MGDIDFYFDFLSPYAYLARHELVRIARDHGGRIQYHPLEIKALKLANGNTGPSTLAMPAKYAFAMTDLARWADRYGIPFQSVKAHDGRDLNVGLYYADAKGDTDRYVDLVFHQCWGLGGKPGDPALIGAVIDTLGWDMADFRAFLVSEAAESAYRQTFGAAVARQVFGVPTITIDDQLWWGNDRLFMVEEYLRDRSA